MSIYIKGFDIPQDGIVRVIMIESDGSVRFYGGSSVIARAVQLPPCGRLGDLDEIWELLEEEKYPETQIVNETDNDDKFWMIGKNAGINAFRRVCKKLQTIIPASGGEEADPADLAEEEPT